jgi:hypothetical protein
LRCSSVPARAAWDRRVETQSGGWTDAPIPHSLAYFKASSCVGRAPNERGSGRECEPQRTTFTEVGSFGQWKIYDLNYYFAETPDEKDCKSVLVQTAPGEFREIFFQERGQPGSLISATFVMELGDSKVVYSRYDVPGRYAIFEEYFLAMSANGSKLMHMEPLLNAAKKQVPANSMIYMPQSEFDFQEMTWTVETEPTDTNSSAKVACCDGKVTVRFKVERNAFVPISAKYERLH